MSGFSSILDITSFFIGVLVNLLLVAMICFYFKRKIDTLEVAQSEQAKILFELVQNNQPSVSDQLPLQSGGTYGMLNNLDLTQLNNETSDSMHNNSGVESESESESDSDGESDSDEDDDNDEGENLIVQDNIEIKKINYEDNNKEDYPLDLSSVEKLTIKELRSLLENKGIPFTKKNIKKKELIDLVMNSNKSTDVETGLTEPIELSETILSVEVTPVEPVDISVSLQPENNSDVIEVSSTEIADISN